MSIGVLALNRGFRSAVTLGFPVGIGLELECMKRLEVVIGFSKWLSFDAPYLHLRIIFLAGPLRRGFSL